MKDGASSQMGEEKVISREKKILPKPHIWWQFHRRDVAGREALACSETVGYGFNNTVAVQFV